MKGKRSTSAVFDQIRVHSGLVVLREIDHGYKYEFWLLDFSPAEFEDWWINRESFWWPVGPENDLIADILGEPRRPHRPPMELPGTFLPAEEPREVRLWVRLWRGKRHYRCNVCCDPDSWLITPDGRHLYHKGYKGPR